uniref:Bloodthirsty-related gene family, member 1 n=1 Tax=Paramormyrops kingsleyae TaxID=1676925 RepID=A0A3B3SM21_9TELE
GTRYSTASQCNFISSELYHCSICLDVFISPISLPCGHSFCMACIREYWSKQTQSRCPMCMRCFENTPELHVNTCIAEIVRTEKEIEDSVRVFTDLIQSIERTRVELLEVIEEKQKAAERRAADLIKEMEAEITELQRRSTELEELSQTEDHIYFLQSFPPPCDDPQTKDWSDIIIHTDHCVGTKWNVYGQLGEHISKVIDEQLQSVDVTFDPKTAHPTLLLSKDGKRVHDGDTVRNVPDNPQRFDCCLCVMATEGFTTGRHYWEVVVKNKTNWDLGVVRESINRKGELTAFPENGFWTIWHRNGTEYSANCSPPVALSLAEKPQKVGVYVDYEQGQVSFYNVDKRSSICTFTGYTFKGKLYPFFSPCHNDGVNNSIINIKLLN